MEKNPENFSIVYKKITDKDLNSEELHNFQNGQTITKAEQALNSYKEGQETACDITADIAAGIVSFGVFTGAVAAAPFSFGSSLAVGLASAGAAGAAVKTGIKYADAKSGSKEYSTLSMDLATGAFDGITAPISGGCGGAAAKGIATRAGLKVLTRSGEQVLKQSSKQSFKQGVKTMLANSSGYQYLGGNALKRAGAAAAEMTFDGMISCSADNTFRAAIKGENVGDAFVEGLIGGAIGAPVIGGSFRGLGKVMGKTKADVIKKANYAEAGKNLSNKTKIYDESEIKIPKGKLAAPSARFAETDAAFENIILKRQKDFIRLSRMTDKKEFTKKIFEIFEEETDLKGLGLKLEITNKDYGGMSKPNGVVEINIFTKNRYGQTVYQSNERIVEIVAHELNHVLQEKEKIVELGVDAYVNAYVKNKYNILKNDPEYKDFSFQDYKEIFLEETKDFMQKIAQSPKYHRSSANHPYHIKAEKYLHAAENYVDANTDYAAYRMNYLESESFRRGELTSDVYKSLIALNQNTCQDLSNSTGLKFKDLYNQAENLEDDGVNIINALFSPAVKRNDPQGYNLLKTYFIDNENSDLFVEALIKGLKDKSFEETIGSTPCENGFVVKILQKTGFDIE